MASSVYAYQRDLMRVYFLQLFAVLDGNQPVFGAMNNIGMTIYVLQPFVGTQLVHQQKLNGQKR